MSHQGGQGGLRHRFRSCHGDPRPGLRQRRQRHAGHRSGPVQLRLHQPERPPVRRPIPNYIRPEAAGSDPKLTPVGFGQGFIMEFSRPQLRHQAAGGRGFLRGRRVQQRPAGSGRGHVQTQPGAAETDERAEHPEAGWIPKTCETESDKTGQQTPRQAFF